MKINYLSISAVLLLCSIMLGCDEDDPSAEEIPSGIESQFYFTGEINGQEITLEEGKNGIANGAGSLSGTNVDFCAEEQSMTLLNPFETAEGIEVVILKNFVECVSECTQILEMFEERTYQYGKSPISSDEEGIEGVIVNYQDADGVYWTTNFNDQTNSSFEISEIKDNDEFWSERITKSHFSCTLYNEDGDSIELINGILVSRSAQCGHL
jgi:hypothetical protein